MENASPKVCATCEEPLGDSAKYCPTCGSRQGGKASIPPPSLVPPPNETESLHKESSADPLIGAVVADRYRIVSLLGRGGMGVVYKVEHSKIGKVMALKLLTGELARSRETVRRFKREALMVSRLSHPNTVQVFDYGSAGGLTYLAMEFLSGRDLGARLESEGPLSFTQLAPIVLQASASLAEAHEKGIVHRDLKPENLYLTRGPNGEELVKVLDFGLAKLRENRELNEVTSSGMIVGTPYYMSPEQVRGEDVDARGDVYALGAVMYTCLTGIPAFDAPTPVAVLTLQLTQTPEAPHVRFPGLRIPRGVSEIVMRALEKDPSDRFQSIEELARAVEGELRGTSLPHYALPESGVYRRAHAEDAATKDEVAAYESSLKNRARAFSVLSITVALGLLFGGYRLYAKSHEAPTFDGHELEPNQEPTLATQVSGTRVLGKLGARYRQDAGDRDFYRFVYDSPATKPTKFAFSGLPNFRTRLALFKESSESPLLRVASGKPGVPVVLEKLSLSPGPYLVVVEQDTEIHFEKEAHYLLENVSDEYSLALGDPASAPDDFETEPNSEKTSANSIAVGGSLEGTLNFIRDTDVVCSKEAVSSHHFVVSDPDGNSRPMRSVLLATPLGGPNDKIPVRIHGPARSIKITERDQKSPLSGPSLDPGSGACVQLELVPNPWAEPPLPILAEPSEQAWKVELVESAPAKK